MSSKSGEWITPGLSLPLYARRWRWYILLGCITFCVLSLSFTNIRDKFARQFLTSDKLQVITPSNRSQGTLYLERKTPAPNYDISVQLSSYVNHTLDARPACRGSARDVAVLLSAQVRAVIQNCPTSDYFEFGSDGLVHLAKDWDGHTGNKSCPRNPVFVSFSVPLTGLASFPGSGSTWSRHLIQQLTGIWTGSVFDDRTMVRDGFLGETRREGTIAIKSHLNAVGARHKVKFTKQILVVRNPFDAIIAEFKRGALKAGHRGHVDINPRDERWSKFSVKYVRAWDKFIDQALTFQGPQLIVLYEDLKTCLLRELFHLANFLKLPGLTQFSVCCALSNCEGRNHRKQGPVDIYNVFANGTRAALNNVLTSQAQKLAPKFPILSERFLQYRML